MAGGLRVVLAYEQAGSGQWTVGRQFDRSPEEREERSEVYKYGYKRARVSVVWK